MVVRNKRPWWHRLRVSVGGLLALVLLFGCGLGRLVESARIQHEAVTALERTRSGIFYNWQRTKVGSFIGYRLNAMPPWPRWLVDRLGPDYFGHVVEVAFQGADADLVYVQALGRLETLRINSASSVSVAGLQHLERITGLRDLDLGFRHVGDDGLEQLRGLTALRSLGLTEAGLTGAGLRHLEGMAGLEQLFLGRDEIDEYHGRMPPRRWLIIKLDRLCAQAIGYELRKTLAFAGR
jgi:hypothetical protein